MQFNKLLATTAAVSLLSGIGYAFAQTPVDNDPAATTGNNVIITADTPKDSPQIMFFKDQGISPETDPSAHLLMIHEAPAPQPVAQVESQTTVAQAEPQTQTTEPAPAPAPTTDTTTSTTANDTTSTTDNTPALAPRADRN